MVHRQSRDKLAETLRQYVSGMVSNDELDLVDVDWRDRGAVAIKKETWHLYDDLCNHQAKGKYAIDKAHRRTVARCIVFLHTETEYLWPDYPGNPLIALILRFITCGLSKKYEERKFTDYKEAGDFSVWPFISENEMNVALLKPRLLNNGFA